MGRSWMWVSGVVLVGLVGYASVPLWASVGSTDDCYTALVVGSGSTLTSLCISSTGNVTKFEAPAGKEHLAVGDVIEGYKVCRQDSFISPFDLGLNSQGFDTPQIDQPNGRNTLPLRITRAALGDLRLVQDFDLRSRPYGPTDLVVTMKAYNTGTITIPGVEIVRFFDADVNGDPDHNTAFTTSDSAAIADFDSGTPRAMILSASILDKPHYGAWSGWNDAMLNLEDSSPYCSANRLAPKSTSTPGDYVGLVTYAVGDILPGRVKTVEYIYRVQ